MWLRALRKLVLFVLVALGVCIITTVLNWGHLTPRVTYLIRYSCCESWINYFLGTGHTVTLLFLPRCFMQNLKQSERKGRSIRKWAVSLCGFFCFSKEMLLLKHIAIFFSHLELKGSFLVSPENPGCGVITWFCSLFSTNRNQTWLDLGSFYPGSMRIFHGSEKTLESWIRRLKCRQCQALAVFSW